MSGKQSKLQNTSSAPYIILGVEICIEEYENYSAQNRWILFGDFTYGLCSLKFRSDFSKCNGGSWVKGHGNNVNSVSERWEVWREPDAQLGLETQIQYLEVF